MEPRPAATMVLVREAVAGPELLLVQRLPTAVFAPGAWVFPGGAVEPSDRELEGLYPELTQRLAQRMDLAPGDAIGYLGAAVRETLEETGILVGSEDPPGVVAYHGTIPSLRTILEQSAIVPWFDNVIYLSRWVTPIGRPRRYDTRFFVVEVGDRCQPVLDPFELGAFQWIRPADALERHAGGELAMMPPTLHTLKTVAAYGSVKKMMRGLRETVPESYLPQLPPEFHT